MLTRIMSSICMAGSCLRTVGLEMWLTLRRVDGKSFPAADRRGAGLPGVLPVDVPLGEALQHLVECDPSFESRQRGAEAEVDAVPEGEVMVDLAVDVEGVAVVEPAVIAVRGAVEEQDGAAGGDGLAVVLDVGGHVSRLDWRRSLVAEDLLDGGRHELAVLD